MTTKPKSEITRYLDAGQLPPEVDQALSLCLNTGAFEILDPTADALNVQIAREQAEADFEILCREFERYFGPLPDGTYPETAFGKPDRPGKALKKANTKRKRTAKTGSKVKSG